MPANDWAPERTLVLPAYYIDRFEVTWREYRSCVEAGICGQDGLRVLPSTKAALTDPLMQNRPVAGIRYHEAVTFCTWKGKRLPTEAEWERAARGRTGSDYPWGNALPSAELLAKPVAYPVDPDPANSPLDVSTAVTDVSPEGIHDLLEASRSGSPIGTTQTPIQIPRSCRRAQSSSPWPRTSMAKATSQAPPAARSCVAPC